MKRHLVVLGFLSLLGSLAVGALLIHCHAVRDIRRTEREVLRISAEEIARRVRDAQLGVAEMSALYDGGAIAKARALARLVASSPSLLGDQSRIDALLDVLDVDEIHVSDERGVLIASHPESYRGYDMNSSAQSAAFMPAVTNAAFELVQAPMKKGIDQMVSKYAGVARIDRPGIVQIGYSLRRLQSVAHFADINDIVRTSRVGRRGRVEIRPLIKGEPRHGRHYVASQFLHRQRMELVNTIEADVGDYRITVSNPVYGTRLADDSWYHALTAAAIALLAFPVLLLVTALASRRLKDLRFVFSELFRAGRDGDIGGVNGPVALACALVFLVGIAVTWSVADFLLVKNAEVMLSKGGEQFRNDFDGRIDEMLFFIGDAITRVYRSPYSFKKGDVADLMKRHHVDEINVVDGDGVVTASSIGIEGHDQWKKDKPREFNQRLLKDGEKVHAQAFRQSASQPWIYRKYAGIAFPEEKGYIQIGFDESRVEREIDYLISDIASGWNIGTSGYFILAKNTGEIVSCGREVADDRFGVRGQLTLAGIGFDMSDEGGTLRAAKLFDEDCLCMIVPLGRFHQLLTVMPRSELRYSRSFMVMLVGAILAVVLLVAGVFFSRQSKLVAKLKGFISRDQERREADLRTARTIQSSSLPLVFPDNDDYRIEAKMFTAREVGGDFFDFYDVPDGRRCVLVADVSGKGIPAAMFMMKAKAILKACMFEQPSLAEAVSAANDFLSENNEAEMFVTAWIGLYDAASGEVEYVSCGHNPPLVRRADGAVEWVRKRPSLVLAAMDGAKFRVERFSLGKGDALFLYTDGVTEAQDVENGFYGEERLARAVAVADSPLVDSVKKSVDGFVGTAEQFDDITMLSLTRKEHHEQ